MPARICGSLLAPLAHFQDEPAGLGFGSTRQHRHRASATAFQTADDVGDDDQDDFDAAEDLGGDDDQGLSQSGTAAANQGQAGAAKKAQKKEQVNHPTLIDRKPRDTEDAVIIYTMNKMPSTFGVAMPTVYSLIDETRDLLHTIHLKLRKLDRKPLAAAKSAALEQTAMGTPNTSTLQVSLQRPRSGQFLPSASAADKTAPKGFL
eukprot:TRINITY_DN87806_c0_g1_i1.p1 TRINITY_DN87806_c0_g1~~TRINITY_DN87806_c0_g1_i1.p1  ORF type:complete len:214 (+),score=35.23 TRINITY_DN87806_c0_g1_i1:28-642(+)